MPHECAQGRLAGTVRNGIQRFFGIPYATPPIGARRWRLPQPAEPWSGVRDATRFGAVCPQTPGRIDRILGHSRGAQSEDCLFLNIWTPSLVGRRPVMVWIHGGAFLIGAGSQRLYDGSLLAAEDVVVVTLNYRLGAFGFVDLRRASGGVLPATGCEGLADQLLALNWVRHNIADFGGDPDNVTVFGESAGAMSIGALLSAPAARGLFHKAIAQSGAAHIGHDPERAERAGRAFLAALGLERSSAARALEVPAQAIVAAQIAVQATARDGHNPHRLGALPFQPVIDGTLLPDAPITAIRAGSARGVTLLSGTNREEWKLFTAANPKLRLMSRQRFGARVERFARDAAPDLLAVYKGSSAFEQFNAFMTDKVFAEPCRRLLEAQADQGRSFAYRCDWRARLLGGIMGACHAVELGFLFGAYRERLPGAFFGQGADADQLSASLVRAWTSFARSGDPGWPAYERAERQTMIFGDGAPYLAARPQDERRQAFAAIADRRLGP
ncbi:MAG: carboxylesterase/lipase family protein [Alphaproteobacteria bacterium]|nr:carboxylesterase/lipase family protein [Alphaproteobacteria bacterium]